MTKKGARAGAGEPQPFKRQAAHAPQHNPAVTQLKSAVSAQSVKRPVAPPVYRPQATPKVLQTKSSSAQSPQSGQEPRQPVAPPLFRPQPTPRVLQAKSN